ncbi:hypothetical protein CEXT_480071, partial [Caerostris extrusa]
RSGQPGISLSKSKQNDAIDSLYDGSERHTGHPFNCKRLFSKLFAQNNMDLRYLSVRSTYPGISLSKSKQNDAIDSLYDGSERYFGNPFNCKRLFSKLFARDNMDL